MIKPTIGRRVWYWLSATDYFAAEAVNFDPLRGPQPFDAGIIRVFSNRCVNLMVTDHNGIQEPRTSVTLVQDCDRVPDSYFATWMPFQVGQAKKESSGGAS